MKFNFQLGCDSAMAKIHTYVHYSVNVLTILLMFPLYNYQHACGFFHKEFSTHSLMYLCVIFIMI